MFLVEIFKLQLCISLLQRNDSERSIINLVFECELHQSLLMVKQKETMCVVISTGKAHELRYVHKMDNKMVTTNVYLEMFKWGTITESKNYVYEWLLKYYTI